MNNKWLTFFTLTFALSVHGRSVDQFPYLTTIVRNGTAICSGVVLDKQRVLSAKSCFLDDPKNYSIVGRNEHDDPLQKWQGCSVTSGQHGNSDPHNLTFVVVHLKPPGMKLLTVGFPQSAPLIDKLDRHDISDAHIVKIDSSTRSVDILSYDDCFEFLESFLSGTTHDAKLFSTQRLLCGIFKKDSAAETNICSELPGAPLVHDGFVVAILTRTFCSSDRRQLAVFMKIESEDGVWHTANQLYFNTDNSLSTEEPLTKTHQTLEQNDHSGPELVLLPPHKQGLPVVKDNFQWLYSNRMGHDRVKRDEAADNTTATEASSGEELSGSGEIQSGSGVAPEYEMISPSEENGEVEPEEHTEVEPEEEDTKPSHANNHDYEKHDNTGFDSGDVDNQIKSKQGSSAAPSTFNQRLTNVQILLGLFSRLLVFVLFPVKF